MVPETRHFVLCISPNSDSMANLKPVTSPLANCKSHGDPNSDEFKEIYHIISGLLGSFAVTGRWDVRVIIEATDQAVTDFEDAMIAGLSRADGRK